MKNIEGEGSTFLDAGSILRIRARSHGRREFLAASILRTVPQWQCCILRGAAGSEHIQIAGPLISQAKSRDRRKLFGRSGVFVLCARLFERRSRLGFTFSK